MVGDIIDQFANGIASALSLLLGKPQEELVTPVKGFLYLILLVVALMAIVKIYRFFK